MKKPGYSFMYKLCQRVVCIFILKTLLWQKNIEDKGIVRGFHISKSFCNEVSLKNMQKNNKCLHNLNFTPLKV